MSRVHEALRRAGESKNVESPARNDEAAFRSAWSLAEEEAAPTADSQPEAELQMVGRQYPAIKGFAGQWRERLALGSEGNSVLVEQFRRLAATLHQAQSAHGIRRIMVTSATPDDGKTLTAINLALVLSESYRRRVLLVDADLRRPSIRDVVNLFDGSGLSETLKARSEQKLALVQLTPTLTLLPAGHPIPDPIGVLTSPRMRRILEEASSRFDWVILDAPPVGQLADASLLGEMVEGTLFVIRAGKTQHPHILKAIEAIGRERILGVVLNAVAEMPNQTYERYYGGNGNGAHARKGETP